MNLKLETMCLWKSLLSGYRIEIQLMEVAMTTQGPPYKKKRSGPKRRFVCLCLATSQCPQDRHKEGDYAVESFLNDDHYILSGLVMREDSKPSRRRPEVMAKGPYLTASKVGGIVAIVSLPPLVYHTGKPAGLNLVRYYQ